MIAGRMVRFIKDVIRKRYRLYSLAINAAHFYRQIRSEKLKVINKGCARITKDVLGSDNILSIGPEAILHNLSLYVRGDHNLVEIGAGCIIGPNCSVRLEGNHCRVKIGAGTTMTRDIHICVQEEGMSIEIGEDCMFSNHITIRTSDSHMINDSTGKRINSPAPVVIGRHVWIAPESTILKGVTLGNNVIVGSKSLVTKSFGDSCLIAGLPATIKKEGVSWTRESLW